MLSASMIYMSTKAILGQKNTCRLQVISWGPLSTHPQMDYCEFRGHQPANKQLNIIHLERIVQHLMVEGIKALQDMKLSLFN